MEDEDGGGGGWMYRTSARGWEVEKCQGPRGGAVPRAVVQPLLPVSGAVRYRTWRDPVRKETTDRAQCRAVTTDSGTQDVHCNWVPPTLLFIGTAPPGIPGAVTLLLEHPAPIVAPLWPPPSHMLSFPPTPWQASPHQGHLTHHLEPSTSTLLRTRPVFPLLCPHAYLGSTRPVRTLKNLD